MGAPRFVLDRFWPSNLFLGGIPGAWYDPTDLSTMFQDSAGTTPVTAVEQPVGLILDKSGNANHATQATAASRPTYRARYNLLTYSEDWSNAVWAGGQFGAGLPVAGTTTTTNPLGVSATVSTLAFPAVAAGQHSFEYQLSPANYLNTSITFSVWMRVASGTGTVFLNIVDGAAVPAGANFIAGPACALTTTWQRFTLTGTRTAATGVATVAIGFDTRCAAGQTNPAPLTVQVWGAQLLTAADVTATGNAYQRIAAATVYDTAPIFRPYLAFDGLDDSLSTAAINFTSTDKMSVFSGVTKNSDAVAYGTIAEIGIGNQAGSFALFASPASNPAGYETFLVGMVNNGGYRPTTYTAPITNVVTLLYNLSAPTTPTQIIPRLNGIVNQTNPFAGVTPGGTFQNYPLYIGRRANSNLPFNGRIYELIVRGAASSVTEIADTELWVNARTGGY